MLFANETVNADTSSSWVTAISAFFVFGGLVCQIVLQVMGQMQAKKIGNKATVAANNAALAAREVKSTLEIVGTETNERLDKALQVGSATHTLVNSNMGAQLKITAVALRRLYNLTLEENDLVAAQMAEKLLGDYQARQAVVDRIPTITP